MYSIPGRDTQMVATYTTTELIQAVIKKNRTMHLWLLRKITYSGNIRGFGVKARLWKPISSLKIQAQKGKSSNRLFQTIIGLGTV